MSISKAQELAKIKKLAKGRHVDSAFKMVKKNGFDLVYCSEELKNNNELVWIAVKGDHRSYMSASKEIRDNDKELALFAIERGSDNILYCNPDWQLNIPFVMESLLLNCFAIQYVDERLQARKNIGDQAYKTNQIENFIKAPEFYIDFITNAKYSNSEQIFESLLREKGSSFTKNIILKQIDAEPDDERNSQISSIRFLTKFLSDSDVEQMASSLSKDYLSKLMLVETDRRRLLNIPQENTRIALKKKRKLLR